MNTNAPEPTTRRKPALWKQATGPIASPLPEDGTVSCLYRWLRTVLPAPAPMDRTADAPGAASIDSRELSSWRPFSPRF
jgi:hypothetical protein